MARTKISTPYPSMKTIARELGVTKKRVDQVVHMVRRVQESRTGKFLPSKVHGNAMSASVHRDAKVTAKNKNKKK